MQGDEEYHYNKQFCASETRRWHFSYVQASAVVSA
jgi:hypothetical protein